MTPKTDSERAADVRLTPQWLTDRLEQIDLNTELSETPRHPSCTPNVSRLARMRL